MNEKRILDLFRNVNEKYINEANPQNRHHYNFRINLVAIAACLCLIAIVGFVASHYMPTEVAEKYYTTSMEEVSSIYEGVLLAEYISYEDANDTTILLCYSGTDLPLRVDDWKTLSVSANYEDYDMTLNCAFNGETFSANKENAIDMIQYGDTTIHIYKAETTSEYDLAYYAVFEYQNVCYELRTYSNDKERIYDILEAFLGVPDEASENSSDSKHNFTDVLGYRDYYVKLEQDTPGFVIQKYYTEIGGFETCIAEVFGYVVPGPEAYSKDLDGDGINELICNCIYGTGAERVYVYRNNNGVIEKGWLSYDSWDDTLFPGIVNHGAGYIQEKYISENDTFEITYYTESGTASVILEDMAMFEFQEFVELN